MQLHFKSGQIEIHKITIWEIEPSLFFLPFTGLCALSDESGAESRCWWSLWAWERRQTQPLEGVPGTAITREAAGAPSAAGGRCSNLSESARGEWLPLCRTDYCSLSGSKAGQDERENWSLLSCLQSSISTQSEGLVYPSTHPLLRTLSLWHGLVSLMHKKRDVITGGTLAHTSVIEDSVGPAEVIYGSEYKHFLEILFIHLSLFKNNPRHLQGEAKCWAVFTLLMYGIYADPLAWIRMRSRAESTKQPTHQTTITDCNTHRSRFLSFSVCSILIMQEKAWEMYSCWSFTTLAACARSAPCIFFLYTTFTRLRRKQMGHCILCEISLSTWANHISLKLFYWLPSERETLHLRVSTFNVSLCMRSPAAVMLRMDNGPV